MKKIFLFVILFCSMPMWAVTKSDATDYNIPVHVSSSRFQGGGLVLTCAIQGRHYELSGDAPTNGLLNPGDYMAKLTKDKHWTAYQTIRNYEFLFPDGTKQAFHVTLLGE
jgi:hypothetical protein